MDEECLTSNPAQQFEGIVMVERKMYRHLQNTNTQLSTIQVQYKEELENKTQEISRDLAIVKEKSN